MSCEGLGSQNRYHNGGALAFGSDGMLYVTVGESHEPTFAQDPSSIGGKVLRLMSDGSVPPDDPIAGNPLFTLGHRNSFGICVDPATGDLWETENGPTSDDEINLLRAGGNYGWPDVMGDGGPEGTIDPVIDPFRRSHRPAARSGAVPSTTVPTSMARSAGSICRR